MVALDVDLGLRAIRGALIELNALLPGPELVLIAGIDERVQISFTGWALLREFSASASVVGILYNPAVFVSGA